MSISQLKADLASLQSQYEELRTAYNSAARNYTQERDKASKLCADQTDSLYKAHARVFERHDVEAMTRVQLISLIEQAINEARRKGMTEAEGLVSRHRELQSTTDLELMRGTVLTYQDRIAEVEAEQKERARQATVPVKLDTRPLSEKLSPAGQTIWPTGTSVNNASMYNAPGWWKIDEKEVAAISSPRSFHNTSFVSFDELAQRAAQDARAKSFAVGTAVTVPGSTGGTYILEHSSIDVYSCTCPAWKFAKTVTGVRTCKHLGAYLGENAERDRVARAAAKSRTTCHCGETLVRGQCQEHTQDWKGDELCTCGRKFSSCKAAYNGISIAQRRYGHQPKLTAFRESGSLRNTYSY